MGSAIRHYFVLALPVILQNLVVFLVDNLNVAILGSLSDLAISAYSIANESFSIYSMVSLGISGGFVVYISHLYAAGNRAKYNQVFRIGMKIIFGMGFAYSLGICVFADRFIGIFAKDREIVELGVEYLRIFAWSLMLYGINLMMADVFVYTGKAKLSMYANFISCIVTLVFSYALVKIFDMGIKGAAIATVVGRLCESIYSFMVLNDVESEFRLTIRYPKMVDNDLGEVFRTSLPLIMNETLYSLAYMIIVKNLTHISERQIACYTIVMNCRKMFTACGHSVGPALNAYVAKNLGNGNFKEAEEGANTITKVLIIIQIFFGIVLMALSGILPGFYSLEGEMAKLCSKMLLSEGFFLVPYALANYFYCLFRLGGDVKHVILFDGIYSFAFVMTLTYLGAYVFKWSFYLTWLVSEICIAIKIVNGFRIYFKKGWVKRLS